MRRVCLHTEGLNILRRQTPRAPALLHNAAAKGARAHRTTNGRDVWRGDTLARTAGAELRVDLRGKY